MKLNTKLVSKMLGFLQKIPSTNLQMSFEGSKNLTVLSVTDGKSQMTAKILSEGGDERSEPFVVDFKHFKDCLRSISTRNVNFSVVGNNLIFDSFTLPIKEKIELVKFGGKYNTVGVKTFHSLIEQTVYAASDDKSKDSLMCCEFITTPNGYNVVTTDGYRLTKADMDNVNIGFSGNTVCMLASYFEALSKVLKSSSEEDFSIVSSEKGYFFVVDGKEWVVDIYIPFENVQYPDYRLYVDVGKESTVVYKIDAPTILGVLKKVKGFSDSSMVSLKLEENSIVIGDKEWGFTEHVTVKLLMKDAYGFTMKFDKGFEISFNVNYLIDYFESVGNVEIEAYFVSERKPAQFKSRGKHDLGVLSVIMPMMKDKK